MSEYYAFEEWHRPNGGYRCPYCNSMCVEAEAADLPEGATLLLSCTSCGEEVWE